MKHKFEIEKFSGQKPQLIQTFSHFRMVRVQSIAFLKIRQSGKLTQAKVVSIKTDLTKQLNNSLTKKVTTVTTTSTTAKTTTASA
ncbi:MULTISPECIES: hypothetical protein [unclassified Paenibacillus]|uniref:hypothetical protein n=1 Tax=unclassified Paenibacillus TaxID=185978 RepID=UPI0004673087|nr:MULTISPECIES: hypothetical protein [unclassified Paenibacillus]KGP83532.1 hypothetical protein P364_0108230 [Paenibacillus sp. MAEPY2]KGP87713.1 hypothetical protein P363_0108420 [Paenibacillus sp. MAEPY1]